MDLLNVGISVVAIIISMVAIGIGYRQYKNSEDARLREMIFEMLRSFSAYRHTYNAMERERRETGSELEGEEKKLFASYEILYKVIDELELKLKELLNKKRIKINSALLGQCLLVQGGCDSLKTQIEFIYERFKRFNDSKVAELEKSIQRIKSILTQFKLDK